MGASVRPSLSPDFRRDALGELERPVAVLAAHLRGRAAAHGREEAVELGLQRAIVPGEVELHHLEHAARHEVRAGRDLLRGQVGERTAPFDPARPLLHDEPVVLVEVEADVGGGREQAQAAHRLQRGPTGRDVGARAVLEHHPHARHVLVVGEDRPAGAVDARDRRADEVSHEVEVVDHQVVDDPDVR